MDWIKLITELLATNLTQREIAERIGVTQSAISQVMDGKSTTQRGFRFEPGRKLIALHKARCRDAGKSPDPSLEEVDELLGIECIDDAQPPASLRIDHRDQPV